MALAEDQFGLAGFGHAHLRAAAQAFAAAAGLQLEPAIPEASHNHPSIIPGDPATCAACVFSAGDGDRTMPFIGELPPGE